MGCKSLTGFILSAYKDLFKEYLTNLIQQVMTNKLRVVLDFGQNSSEGQFEGIDSVVRGVEVIKLLLLINLFLNVFFFS
jgi:hypothetical protein